MIIMYFEKKKIILGANASAEGGDEGADDADTITGADVVLAHRLSATGFDKKGWTVYIKDFMKVMP